MAAAGFTADDVLSCVEIACWCGREDFRFALKTREPVGIDREWPRQDLDRDLALEFRVDRPIYLPHPAFPDRRGDVVDTEARAGVRTKCGASIGAEPAG